VTVKELARHKIKTRNGRNLNVLCHLEEPGKKHSDHPNFSVRVSIYLIQHAWEGWQLHFTIMALQPSTSWSTNWINWL